MLDDHAVAIEAAAQEFVGRTPQVESEAPVVEFAEAADDVAFGAVAGGGQGAAIGAGVGATAGAGSVLIQGRDRIELSEGSEFSITASAPGYTGVYR